MLAEILEAFGKLGYRVEHQVMKAVEFGVPQKRERVFILGTLDDEPIRFPEPLFSDESEHLPNTITAGEAISDLEPLGIGWGYEQLTPYAHSEPTPYQRLMRGEIDFEKFLAACLEREGLERAPKQLSIAEWAK